MPFHFETSVRTNEMGRTVTVVRLAGELDASSAPEAQRGFARALADGPKALVVDLADLQFIDSTGISVILSTRIDLKKAGTTFVMMNMQRPIRRVFDIVKALPGVPVFGSMPELDAYLAKVQKEERQKGG